VISGAFFTFAVLRFGVGRFREAYVNSEDSDLVVGRWYEPLVKYLIPMEIVALIGWWFWAVILADPDGWWNPFHVESVGTYLFQWGTVLLVLLVLNRWIARKTLGEL
jgi:NSS family neurotransmitter:Na+ symporter